MERRDFRVIRFKSRFGHMDLQYTRKFVIVRKLRGEAAK